MKQGLIAAGYLQTLVPGRNHLTLWDCATTFSSNFLFEYGSIKAYFFGVCLFVCLFV